jgi:16S rRNA (guanine966-N2)-methyltransferase
MRVIAGTYGGRRLQAPPGTDTRPTADRVREALFSILGDRVPDARVLDLFAGSGALGIEALSRGAAHATFVESGPPAVAAIRSNIEAIGQEGDADVAATDVLAWLRSAREQPAFDLVFCDPPYDAAARIAQPLSELLPRVAGPQGLIVTESSKRNPLALSLPLADERTYGDTRIALHRVG